MLGSMEYKVGDRVHIDAEFPGYLSQLEATGTVLAVHTGRELPYEVRYRASAGAYDNVGYFSADQLEALTPEDDSDAG